MLMFFNLLAQASTLRVSPISQKEITNGDLLNVELTSDEDFNWDNLKLKKIGDIFHVLEVEKRTPQLASAKVMAMPESDKSYDGFLDISGTKFKVELVGFTFNFKNISPINDFVILDSIYDLKNNNYVYFLLGILLSFLIMYLGRKKIHSIFIKYQQKKNLKQKRQKIIKILHDAKERKDFELVYQMKDSILETYQIDKKEIKDFVLSMNSIQYLPQWTSVELELAQKALEKLKQLLRDKRGI